MVTSSKAEMDGCRNKNKIDVQREAEGIVHEAPEAQRGRAGWSGSGYSTLIKDAHAPLGMRQLLF